ncbi:DUF3592 domain-containing protein [Streptomyces sp. NPDC057445]|uniref:DUF3592 domain-containing protein n=1 Tax=Streptomyces sp. NPDC057445 TaxID=3346136 RepID=UPI00368B3787
MANEVTWAVVCAAVAVLLLGVAGREALAVRRLRRDGIVTRGVVVGEQHLDDSDGHLWVPVVAFHDEQGKRMEFTPPTHGSRRRPVVGREVEVLHLPGRPETARVREWQHITGSAVYPLFGAALFLGGAVLVVLKSS